MHPLIKKLRGIKTMVKVRISKEEYVRTEKILNGVPHFQYPDFIEVEAELLETNKIIPVIPPGHVWVEEKCEHMWVKSVSFSGTRKLCNKCGVDFPQSPKIEELGQKNWMCNCDDFASVRRHLEEIERDSNLIAFTVNQLVIRENQRCGY